MRLITEHQGSRRRKREEINRTNSKLPEGYAEFEGYPHPTANRRRAQRKENLEVGQTRVFLAAQDSLLFFGRAPLWQH